jgi:hypothetical protein
MTKAQQKAFNDAYMKTVKSRDRKLVPDKKKKQYVVMVPVGTVIKNFKKFVQKVNKDLGISKSSKKK